MCVVGLIHPSQLLFWAPQPAAGQRQDDAVLGHHNEEEGGECEKAEGGEDVEVVLGRSVVTPPGDSAGPPVRIGDVLAPAEQGEAGPDGGHQPDEAACSLDVGSFYPVSCAERATLAHTAAATGSNTLNIISPQKTSLWATLICNLTVN